MSTLGNVNATVEEASAAQPISLKQRGTRLSFLGGKRKNSKDMNSGDSGLSSGDAESNSSRGQKEANNNRKSFFRTHTGESNLGGPQPNVTSQPQGEVAATDWAQSMSRKSSEVVDVYDRSSSEEKPFSGARIGSVRKRLSMLRLGGKWPHKAHGPMGGVDEE